jgi:pSer/pThr/pTyr-binding forkhead associated (FHA) protein
VLDDSTVSRRHALVLERGGKPVIADDRSLNGVFVNGRRVREARLQHGDEVQIGDRAMRYLEVQATNASNAGRADPSASRSPQS